MSTRFSSERTHARALGAPVRFGLTGTAMQNKLNEFWVLMSTIVTDSCGQQKEFAAAYTRPILAAQRAGANAPVKILQTTLFQVERTALHSYTAARPSFLRSALRNVMTGRCGRTAAPRCAG